jgi:hypothetical protein
LPTFYLHTWQTKRNQVLNVAIHHAVILTNVLSVVKLLLHVQQLLLD